MTDFGHLDVVAALWFVVAIGGFSWVLEKSSFRHVCLSAAMDRKRREWMRNLAQRDLRMIDTSIVAGLQNGTAFFASTSLLAIGACFALLNATDQVLQVLRDLPFDLSTSRSEWEMKILGLMVLYSYAFFKFGWAYRLFNYTSILVGAVPMPGSPDSSKEEIEAAADQAADLSIIAARHFHRGLRAFFFAIGYLGWFISAEIFIATTLLILLVLARRQFISQSARTVLRPDDDGQKGE